jgi:hypothetical protein
MTQKENSFEDGPEYVVKAQPEMVMPRIQDAIKLIWYDTSLDGFFKPKQRKILSLKVRTGDEPGSYHYVIYAGDPPKVGNEIIHIELQPIPHGRTLFKPRYLATCWSFFFNDFKPRFLAALQGRRNV